jgi:hypothetical protein
MRNTRRNMKKNKKNGGGWTQGPPLSSEQYYLTEYKAYNNCYPMERPGSIQSNPNPELAQIPMAGGSRQRKTRRNQKKSKMTGGNSCREYFLTRGGARKNRKSGGCGCMMRGGVYGECPYKSNAFNCPYKQGGKRSDIKRMVTKRNQKKNFKRNILKGGRYVFDVSSSIGGDGPIVAPIVSNSPCEAHRPMQINPQQPSELVSAPETGIHFAGLSPGAVLKGGARKKKQQGGDHPLAYTAPNASYTFFPNIAQGQVLNPGQIPYQVVVPTNGSDSISCGKTCDGAITEINKQ